MNRYLVSYYYLATGMEGKADEYDIGVFSGKDEKEAIDNAIKRYTIHEQQWMKGCLRAELV